VKFKQTILALGGVALVSCAAPKAVVIEGPPLPKKEVKAPAMLAAPAPAAPLPDDGLRMPDMLAMPAESEFRASNPAATKVNNEAGAVIARPPKPAGPPAEP